MKMRTPYSVTGPSAIALVFASVVAVAAARSPALWTIGTPDGAAMEFAPGSRPELTFTVGQSVVSKEFAGSQGGSVEWDGKTGSPTALASTWPRCRHYELVLDLIYHSGRRAVQGHKKDKVTFSHPAGGKKALGRGRQRDVDGKQQPGADEGAWLRAGNKLVLTPLGMGSLATTPSPSARGGAPETARDWNRPYSSASGREVRKCDLVVLFTQRFERATAPSCKRAQLHRR
jgi:hypothetical protein